MENKELLIEKLSLMNVYDLERLRECFEYELTVEPANHDYISDILRHISIVMDQKASE